MITPTAHGQTCCESQCKHCCDMNMQRTHGHACRVGNLLLAQLRCSATLIWKKPFAAKFTAVSNREQLPAGSTAEICLLLFASRKAKQVWSGLRSCCWRASSTPFPPSSTLDCFSSSSSSFSSSSSSKRDRLGCSSQKTFWSKLKATPPTLFSNFLNHETLTLIKSAKNSFSVKNWRPEKL